MALNSSMNRLAMKVADGGTHGCTMDLFIVLTLEEEVGVFEAELQECDNLGYGHLGPLGECWVLCESLLNNGDCRVYWH